ncbi:hypothetical protein DFP72DRAFT_1091851 [Ephemerocybe angulata]|uniref:BTB domain-containing protein n=1 Tax=Ephemerocybe angulata TaxID=980116 RepID=A0A8H6I888_9AGAR|nr:hypothetical protein DFP72DRAFT_1091851 [Tulosesus angulatus]
MTLIHDFFHAKNFQGFQRLLEGTNDKKQNGGASGAPGTSGGYRAGPLTPATVSFDVNARDWLGRTVLHLAVTSDEYSDYLRLLLKHPSLNVNAVDVESQWTPLHRAMYHANISAARLLLQRSDIDISLKDKEGYTAFDVYNSTVNGTKPDTSDKDAELFTWGANRNAALGLGDGDDRVHPDQVVITPKEALDEDLPLLQRFSPIRIRDVHMSKLHTAVITSESAGNLRVCGFGSGGRLGRGQQMQFDLNPLPQFDSTIVSVALGQDHTLAVTKAGEVLSWGLNRFSQLGYVVETTSGKFDEPIQAAPKKIVNPLKKEVVIGVAASKTASACWTAEDVYTWGTNHGQLGYDKQAHPTQIIPRKVTKFSGPIIAMSMTDNVIACLMRTQQVECLWNDRHYRVNFPVNAFPSEIQPYRPPQAVKASHIAKLAASEDLVAALSSNGEVFTFSPPSVSSEHNNDGNPDVRHPFQPQRIWALRKKFSSVQDVAIGPGGSIIICTESGHVYVRIRNTKGVGKNFKFQRVPYLQRITHVAANSTGAFGALRVDFKPKTIDIKGNTLAQDLATVEPFAKADGSQEEEAVAPAFTPEEGEEEEEREDMDLAQDIIRLRALLAVWRQERERTTSSGAFQLPARADTIVQIGKLSFPAHRTILACRSHPLSKLFGDGSPTTAAEAPSFSIHLLPAKPGPGLGITKISTVKVAGITPLTLLVLLHYLYSDEVLAIWDRRINVGLARDCEGLKVDVGRVKSELQMLARALVLPALQVVLEAPVKRVPAPTLPRDLGALFDLVQVEELGVSEALKPDVVLEFMDRDVWTHSTILRCRSAFFSGLFGSREWTERRWTPEGVLRLDFKHLRWHVMQYVLRFMVCGEDREMFDVLTFVKSTDGLLEFMFEVMGAATEFLLDRLLLICSSVILAYLDIHNCCYILSEATHYHAVELIARVHEYMAANMESLLESRFLDELPKRLLEQLSAFIGARQTEKSKFTRTSEYLDGLLAKYWDWLAEQDIPAPIVRSMKSITRESVPRLKVSPPASREVPKQPMAASSLTALPQSPPPSIRHRPSGDELFAMDMQDTASPSNQRASLAKPTSEAAGPAWKVADAPRVDMKTLMAEAESSRPGPSGSPKYVAKKSSTETRFQAPEREAGPSYNPMFPPVTPTKPQPARNPNSPWRSASASQRIGEPSPSSTSSSSFPSIRAAATSTPTKSPAVSGPPSGGLSMSKPPPASPHAQQRSGRQARGPALPGLGPIINPTKQASKSAGNSIRVASGKAWMQPPPEPVKPVATTKPAASMSFAAIQAQEERSAAGSSVKDKRTLKEIQQEEAELQQEADFLKWWTGEEERMRKEEMAALEAFQAQSQSQGGGKGGKGGGGAKGGAGMRQSGGGAGSSNAKRGKGKGKGPGRDGQSNMPQSSSVDVGPGGDVKQGGGSSTHKASAKGGGKQHQAVGTTGQGNARRQARKPSNQERPPQQ